MPLGHRSPAYKFSIATKLRICEANKNKLITDRHMKISNNGGQEQNNVMFIDALRSIAPHRAKQAIDKNKYKI